MQTILSTARSPMHIQHTKDGMACSATIMRVLGGKYEVTTHRIGAGQRGRNFWTLNEAVRFAERCVRKS